MHILIVEDESAIRQELKLLLENALYQVTALDDFTDVPEQVLSCGPDLVLLDLNLPGESGFDICTRIRVSSEVPIIFVTSRTDSMDELTGLMKGGDDYITKPFQAPILLAHIAAVLKRAAREGTEVTKLTHKGAELDIARGSLSFCGQVVELTKNELKIMHYLFLNKEKIVSRANLIEYLWDNQVFIDDNTLSVNMTRIRAKLEQAGMHDFIRTKRGMGYSI
nr:response regulator transcription factor [uncultured Schaedlerella sp.]